MLKNLTENIWSKVLKNLIENIWSITKFDKKYMKYRQLVQLYVILLIHLLKRAQKNGTVKWNVILNFPRLNSSCIAWSFPILEITTITILRDISAVAITQFQRKNKKRTHKINNLYWSRYGCQNRWWDLS